MTEDCGLIHLLDPGDVVMADKGFDIQHLLAPKKAILKIPPFMGGKEHRRWWRKQIHDALLLYAFM